MAIEAGTAADSGGVTHTMPRTGTGGVTTFKASWSSDMATGVVFFVNGMSANGDNTPRGDAPGSATLSIAVGCSGQLYYLDQDSDGYGTLDPGFAPRKACTPPQGYAALTGDCNDFDPSIHPGAPELCDHKDNNCDGKIDENVVYQMYCEDKDGDGHGVTGGAMKTDCAPSAGFGDCARRLQRLQRDGVSRRARDLRQPRQQLQHPGRRGRSRVVRRRMVPSRRDRMHDDLHAGTAARGAVQSVR